MNDFHSSFVVQVSFDAPGVPANIEMHSNGNSEWLVYLQDSNEYANFQVSNNVTITTQSGAFVGEIKTIMTNNPPFQYIHVESTEPQTISDGSIVYIQVGSGGSGSGGSQTITIPHEVLSGGSHTTMRVLRLIGVAAPANVYGTLEHTLSTQRPSELMVSGELSGRKIMATFSSSTNIIDGTPIIVPTGRDLELHVILAEIHSGAFSALMTFSAT
jgi:hypothetical protein